MKTLIFEKPEKIIATQTDAPDGPGPGEAQVRNPRRLRALAAACRVRRVEMRPGEPVVGVRGAGGGVAAVETAVGEYSAGAYVFAAGCWTGRVGVDAAVRPVRGQMLLLRATKVLDRVVHRYPHYAVPRRDGLVLVGATVEEAGFDKRTTAAARSELLAAAAAIDERLGTATVEGFWSGLRPATDDGLPLVGRVPGWDNAWLAAGHHRSGLQLAPPTADVIAAQVLGLPSGLDATRFAPDRFKPTAAA